MAGLAKRCAKSACAMAVALSCVALPAHADEIVGPGGTKFVTPGLVDLSCTDLLVGGTVHIQGNGTFVNVRNVRVDAGGLLDIGTGSVNYSGTLTNNGQITGNAPILNTVCGGPPRPIPTLTNAMLMALAAMLMLLAGLILGNKGVLRHRSETRGVGK